MGVTEISRVLLFPELATNSETSVLHLQAVQQSAFDWPVPLTSIEGYVLLAACWAWLLRCLACSPCWLFSGPLPPIFWVSRLISICMFRVVCIESRASTRLLHILF